MSQRTLRKSQVAQIVLVLGVGAVSLGLGVTNLMRLHQASAMLRSADLAVERAQHDCVRAQAATADIAEINQRLEYQNHVMRDLLLLKGIRVHFGPADKPERGSL